MEQAPNSPDLVPSYFHLSSLLNPNLADKELQQTPTRSKLSAPDYILDTDFFCARIQALMPRWYNVFKYQW
jgi:hypothetical protein